VDNFREISGAADFEHPNLVQILRTNLLEFLVTIKEQVYPELVYMFYSNLYFSSNIIHSRVKDFDINISLEEFARMLHLSCEATDIFDLDFDDFEFPVGEIALTTSQLLHSPVSLVKARSSWW